MEKSIHVRITDLAYLRQISNGDTDFLKEMIDLFLEQTPEIINDLKMHLNTREWKKLAALIHKIKPSSQFFGLGELYDIAILAEEYANNETDLELLTEMINRIISISAKAVEELKQETSGVIAQ
jgi:HPt (histidine-containing phosphotransfer) domain-containing protein